VESAHIGGMDGKGWIGGHWGEDTRSEASSLHGNCNTICYAVHGVHGVTGNCNTICYAVHGVHGVRGNTPEGRAFASFSFIILKSVLHTEILNQSLNVSIFSTTCVGNIFRSGK
jgi:hypothetical protein